MIEQTELCAGSNGYIDTANSEFRGVSCTGASLYVNGSGNTVDLKSGLDTLTSVVNAGAGNQVSGLYLNNPNNSKEPTVKQALLPTRGSRATGTIAPDFIANGNVATPYYGNGDLFFWPEDMIILGVNTTPTARRNFAERKLSGVAWRRGLELHQPLRRRGGDREIRSGRQCDSLPRCEVSQHHFVHVQRHLCGLDFSSDRDLYLLNVV